MKATVIPEDKWIRRDDDAAVLEAWPFDDAHIHAIQWENGKGEIELKGDPRPANQAITDDSVLTPYLEALDERLAELAAAQAAADALAGETPA